MARKVMQHNSNKTRRTRGAVSLEYILVCAVFILAICALIPPVMDYYKEYFQAFSAMIGSPFPAGL